MAWNNFSHKSLQSPEVKSILTPGAPVAFNTGLAGRPYKDAWDIERAYREGMQKVTWVSRCSRCNRWEPVTFACNPEKR
jgi:hypothetical protein